MHVYVIGIVRFVYFIAIVKFDLRLVIIVFDKVAPNAVSTHVFVFVME